MMLVASLFISGSYDRIAGYAPGSQVTDHNAVDLDQAVMESHLKAATDEAQRSEYGSLFREVLCGTIVRNFDKLNGLAYTAGGSSTKGDKFVIVSGTFTDTSGSRPPVAVNWRVLTREGKPPRVFDIEIENLSLLVTQKQENVAVVRKNKGQFIALIEAMRERLEAPVHNN